MENGKQLWKAGVVAVKVKKRKTAIRVSNLEKVYKLYDRPSDRMKEALGLSKRKRYKAHHALAQVDMTVYQGETVGIIGTNGSGKSTILKIITGVLMSWPLPGLPGRGSQKKKAGGGICWLIMG